MYDIEFTDTGLSHYKYWQKHNPKIAERIIKLLQQCCQSPYEGIGKPEPLKYELSGLWSRRIDRRHRLVYEIVDTVVLVHACRYHYKG